MNTGFNIYSAIKKSSETDEDRACDSLIRIIFRTPRDVLEDISNRYFNGMDIKIDKDFKKKRQILESLFKSFEKYSEESFSYLQEHHAVTTFRSSIIFQLEVNKYQRDNNDVINDKNLSKIIESFQEGFDTLFDQQIENDADIQRPRRKDSVAKYDFSLLLL